MFFPISDDDRGLSGPAYVTFALIAINVAVFLYQATHPEITYGWSVIPKEITTGRDLVEAEIMVVDGKEIEIPEAPGPPIIYLTLFTSMFMHAGVLHLFGNMLFLWIFGDNVEHRFGHALFLIFYLLSGLIASLAQIAVGPESVIPNLGASGAIFGVLGAYLVLFPRNRVNVIIFYFVVSLPAIAVIGVWAALQVFPAFGAAYSKSPSPGGVAYMAHLGGILAGIVMGVVTRVMMKKEPDSVLYRQYRNDPRSRLLW
jgi:membrane associated rhomboid family serine protease